MSLYLARVGDVFEYEGYIGIITAIDADYTKADWIIPYPDYMFRQAHNDADWYVPREHLDKFKLICNVREK